MTKQSCGHFGKHVIQKIDTESSFKFKMKFVKYRQREFDRILQTFVQFQKYVSFKYFKIFCSTFQADTNEIICRKRFQTKKGIDIQKTYPNCILYDAID